MPHECDHECYRLRKSSKTTRSATARAGVAYRDLVNSVLPTAAHTTKTRQ